MFVLTLGKTNNKDEVDDHEAEEICADHFVDHHDERPNVAESSTEEEEVRSSAEDREHAHHVFVGVRARCSPRNHQNDEDVRELEQNFCWTCNLNNHKTCVLSPKFFSTY